jgi:hypothetical protein
VDLNHLLFRHQVSLARATTAASREARSAHRGLARGYATRIAALQPWLEDGTRPFVMVS